MATAKIINRKQPNKDGTYSIILQIIHLRKAYPKTICHVPVEDWDIKKLEVRTRNPDSAILNSIIEEEISAARSYILESRLRKTPIDPSVFLNSKKVDQDILSHLRAKMNSFSNKRTRSKYSTCIIRIEENKLNRLVFDINRDWIRLFTDVLKSEGNNANTRTKYLSSIGSVMRDAKRNGLITVNPFEGLKKHSTPSKKAKLNLEEFKLLQDARFDDDLEIVRRFFVFITLARGMRSFDGLTLLWSNINSGRLLYRAQKAAEDKEGKLHDIKITDEMVECLEGLDRNREYVFPFVTFPKSLYSDNIDIYLRNSSRGNPKFQKNLEAVDRYIKHTDSWNTRVNNKLKIISTKLGLDKKITIHVARHTFAYLCDQANIPLGTTQQFLGHGDITTTKIYVESIRKSEELDEAAKNIFT